MILNYFLSLLSAVLLALTFPQTNIWILAWIGFVPLFCLFDKQNYKQAGSFGFLSGFIFFFISFFWLTNVTVVGTILLSLYCAIYFGCFALGYQYFSKQNIFFKIIVIPSLWVALEYTRAHLFSGFGWAALGESQSKALPLIQIVDITGIYGLSFLIVMVNVLLKEFFNGRFLKKEIYQSAIVVLLVLGIVLSYGFFRLNQTKENLPQMSVAVVQASIPQEMKWVESLYSKILNDHQTLTELAAQEKPDLIVWPETSFPDIIGEDEGLFAQLQDFVRGVKIPLLFGSVLMEDDAYYNSAVLLSNRGEVVDRYDKIRLVPFGEFIPFRHTFPALQFIVPIADFTAGHKHTIFSFPSVREANGSTSSPLRFSTLICFEDTLPALARKFVNQGAQLLINITNDAWFKDSKEPFMHLQSSVFRAVENRRDLIRAANTGVSCFIDRFGHITKYVEDTHHKKTFVINYAVAHAQLNSEKTFYTKFGDIFTYFCFGCILLAVLKTRRHEKNSS